MDERDEKLFSDGIPAFDAAAGLARFRERASREGIVPAPRLGRLTYALTRPWTRPVAAAMGAVVVVLALSLSGVADTILTVFEPQRIATVNVPLGDMSGVPDPVDYGTFTWVVKPTPTKASDVSAAAVAAGFTPLVPSALPAGVPTQPRLMASGQAKATFQFDEAKARAAAAKVGATLPPMPAEIAATTLTLTGGPVIVQQYGAVPQASSDSVSELARTSGPQLVIVQSRVPVVTSNGATVNELRDYALRQPGIPPQLAAQIRAIGDPVRTLMLPVGMDIGSATSVSVRGTQGYLVGDKTGLGSGVVWVENGYVFGVLGTLTDTQLLALVNGLR